MPTGSCLIGKSLIWRNLHPSLKKTSIIATRVVGPTVSWLIPVSHPSPPNRYRDGAELAEQIEDLRDLLQTPTTEYRKKPASMTTFKIDTEPKPSNLKSGFGAGCWLGMIVVLASMLAVILGIMLWPSGTPVWVAGANKIQVPPQVISVALPADSPKAGDVRDWVGLEVLVRGSVMNFAGGNTLTFYYDAPIAIDQPTVTLKGSALKSPVTLNLPKLVAGRGQVTVFVPIPAEIPKGQYRIQYEPKSLRPLVRAKVSRAMPRKLHFSGWSASIQSVIAVFNDVQTEPVKMDKCEVSHRKWRRCVEKSAV